MLDCSVFDLAHSPLSFRLKFSAIVTDPPYGVRAGAKKLGAASPKDSKPIPLEFRPITYPTTQPYKIDEMTRDLLNFAANHLLLKGRLIFWYPVEVEEIETFKLENITQHPKFNLISSSLHRCKGFDRWMVTMELKE